MGRSRGSENPSPGMDDNYSQVSSHSLMPPNHPFPVNGGIPRYYCRLCVQILPVKDEKKEGSERNMEKALCTGIAKIPSKDESLFHLLLLTDCVSRMLSMLCIGMANS